MSTPFSLLFHRLLGVAGRAGEGVWCTSLAVLVKLSLEGYASIERLEYVVDSNGALQACGLASEVEILKSPRTPLGGCNGAVVADVAHSDVATFGNVWNGVIVAVESS